MQLILQRLDRDLVEVHKRGEPREEHAEEEHQPDHAPSGHPVEHVHEENEHQSRAAVGKVRAACRHRGNDDERRQQRRQRIEQRHIARGGGDRLVGREVGAVDHRAVSRHGEREERLPEGVDPQLRVGKAHGVEGKDVAVAVARAGQRRNVDAQSRKEKEQHRHHDLVRPLDAAAHAEGHDGEVDRQRDHQDKGSDHCHLRLTDLLFAAGLFGPLFPFFRRCSHSLRTALFLTRKFRLQRFCLFPALSA